METVLTLIAYAASIAVWIRFRSYFRFKKRGIGETPESVPRISIIVPARNEEDNIAQLLTSTLRQKRMVHEVIVVDDESTDNTRAVAEKFPVKVLRAGARPVKWIGKSWACQVGAERATGELLLFTDADTIHHRYSLRRAWAFMRNENAHMISAPAFHLNKHWWEKLLGPFHCLMHAGASPYDRPKNGNAYAMGQFLMIRRDMYNKIGGHSAVKDVLTEDAALANRVIQAGANYKMYNGMPVCSIQMYQSISDFISGWGRLMRSGVNVLSVEIVLTSLIPLFALNLFNLPRMNWVDWIPALSALACFALVQNRIGRFNVAGIFLFPFSVALFIGIGLFAMVSEWMKLPVTWRGRSYPVASQQ